MLIIRVIFLRLSNASIISLSFLNFLNGSSLDSILDKLNLFSVHLAHFEVFICKISVHCLIYFMVLNYSDWFNIKY